MTFTPTVAGGTHTEWSTALDKMNLKQTAGVQIERATRQPSRAIVNIKVQGIPATMLVIEGQPFEMRIGAVDFELEFEKVSE